MNNTDRDHLVSSTDVIAHLNNLGIRSERKAIYEDIKVLNRFGIKIVKSHNRFYYEKS